MDSYSFDDHDAFMAIIERGQKEKYPIELSATDFRVFVTILRQLALFDKVTHKDIPSIPGYGEDGDMEPIGDWAWSWYSGIAETLGIELI